VVGEAGVLVDPCDVEGLAGAMARVLGDGALRARLRVQGPERAARFSWEATARTIVDAYRRVWAQRDEQLGRQQTA
jgi:glycosyltransferase involved in cell wall biosynthesis